MAKATTKIRRIELSEEEKRTRDLEEIQGALIENKEAILETVELLGNMRETGVLSLANGLFGQSDKVASILVKTMDKPENINAIKNILLMFGTLGMINVKQLEPILLKVDAGIANMTKNADDDDDEKIGYLDMIQTLKDPDVNKSISMIFDFLKGMGTDVEGLEKNTDGIPPNQTNQNETFSE